MIYITFRNRPLPSNGLKSGEVTIVRQLWITINPLVVMFIVTLMFFCVYEASFI